MGLTSPFTTYLQKPRRSPALPPCTKPPNPYKAYPDPHTSKAIQRTLTLLTAHQNRWRREVTELLERINQVVVPLEIAESHDAYGVIVQQALAQLDDDEFAQWVATVWGDRPMSPTSSRDLEDWGVATLESQAS
ncbi:MAG: hypothetical protein AAGF75_09810 [Cyanobacteria bacterium P01_H01_bin.130]